MEKIYSINNLDCANCANKIETEINKIEEIESAVLVFATKKLHVKGNISSDTEKHMQNICDNIENGVIIQSDNNSSEVHRHSNSIKNKLVPLIIGIVFYAAAIITSNVIDIRILSASLYGVSYLLLGYDIILGTFKGIKSHNLFDENFLMAVATIGAFILGDYSEAVGVVLFFKIGSVFEDYAVDKSRKAISAAAELKVNTADILVNGEYITSDSEMVKIGDTIRIKAGERIPVDGVITSGYTRLDMSAINGEPVPVSANIGDTVVSGSINTANVITIRSTALAKDSMMSKIAEAIENAASSKPEIDKFITKFAKIYTPAILSIAALTALIPSIVTGNVHYWVYAALTFLVISCPCALVLSIPLSFFSGIGAASKLGILFKGGNSLEALSKVKAVVMDKTGTITTGTFDVTEIETYNNFEKTELLRYAAMCEQNSTHPVAVSIMKYCMKNNIEKPSMTDAVKEIPGKGIAAEFENKSILCGNVMLMNENNIEFGNNSATLGSGSIVYVAVNNVLAGKITVSDTIKETSVKAIDSFRAMALKTAMLTGDRTQNAGEIAEKVHIDEFSAQLLPEEKLQELAKIRKKYGSVLFIGDGINDGPVLAGADVGAAMNSGADLALEAADVVLMNSKLSSAVQAKKIADKTAIIVRENIIFALVIKAAVLLLGLLGVANMWFAVFADSGTAMLLILNSMRILSVKKYMNPTA